ncbi:Metal resistance protein YCF1 [Neolecta irregularis DAH-3]|uniref:Metal resistance protein YCF1 n=1 Tax=Neolecta irregularis (strain DAH-3) TaxID=1198029 RepID=A0A1U7LWM9_NEOID|nr:Metal resistance protein YCF1 [Neolecta irregularis DAH-3]|eukprot:OLL26952.1 Metal resistance protein YCF1 [Neolecta irregularis DAH-3]
MENGLYPATEFAKNLGLLAQNGILASGLVFSSGFLVALQPEFIPQYIYDIRFWSWLVNLFTMCVIFAIHHVETGRSKVPSGSLLLYYLVMTIIYGIKLRSIVIRDEPSTKISQPVLFSVFYGLLISLFLCEWLLPMQRPEWSLIEEEDNETCPAEAANIFSRQIFRYIIVLICKAHVQLDDANDATRKHNTASHLVNKFEYRWQKQLEKKNASLWRAIGFAYGGPYLISGIFKAIQDALSFAQPQLLRRLIAFVETYNTDQPEPLIRGISIASAMFFVSVIQTVALHQYFERAFETGMRIRAGLTAAIYRKSLVLSNDGKQEKSTGDIVNLMSVDTQRLQDLTQYAQTIWSAPFQITLCLISLYDLVGYSMVAGIAIMILMIPVNTVIANKMKNLQVTQMKNKDARTRLMTEILNNIKSIKLYAWEPAFMERLRHVRNDLELRQLRKIGILNSISNFAWACTPFLVSCSTFAVFVLTQNKPLSTQIVFPALALFNLLSFPLAFLPIIITSIIEARVAVQRLTSFLNADELQQDALCREPAVSNLGDENISIENGTFRWIRNSPNPTLQDINFTARKGDLSCIVGRVGCGKTSLISAMLGEMHKDSGNVVIKGKIAYAAQQPWIMNASIKENIIFGHRYEEEFYRLTLEACALLDDLTVLPDGDQTEVGEKGISLSGGQKARVSLARAVYARADIYLLDDPLSAVDQHVGRHIIDRVLGPQGMLASKTRVLATNSIPILAQADHISMIKAGKIVEHGTFQQVMEEKAEIFNLIKEFGKSTESSEDVSMTSGSTTLEDIDSNEEDTNELKRIYSMGTLRRASDASFQKPHGKILDTEGKISQQIGEFSERGKVKWNVYFEYAKASSMWVASVAGNLWLKHWSEVNSEAGANPSYAKYLGIYFILGIGSSALTVIYTLILWIFCAIQSGRKLHEAMAKAIFRSPMIFFETTPIGRILNRFSNDIYKIDEVLARTFSMFFRNSIQVLFVLIVISASTPTFVAFILPLTFVYLYIQRYYLRTSRELKRLDSVTKSPMYAHFQESLGGITTIRSYDRQARFVHENEWKVDLNQKAYFPSINANRWLAVRLEFIGSLILLVAAMLSVLSLGTKSGISAGLVGLAMSYALQITQSLNWIVRLTVEVETNIVSVERVLEYSRLPAEADSVVVQHRPGRGWPMKGQVKFENYSARYRPGLDLVLKDITFEVKPMEKIGIVGRTGAGKSSLTLALFRIIEAAQGHIDVDDVDTSKIGLADLRDRLSIIPQDSQAFEGTMRENLDPRGEHDDAALWQALSHSHLRAHVQQMDGQLDARICEGG